jgi:hypothetical protein
MGLTYYRIYDAPLKSRSGRQMKGRKKKHRRMNRASNRDGWERKQAGGLAPAFRPSKKNIDNEYVNEIASEMSSENKYSKEI